MSLLPVNNQANEWKDKLEKNDLNRITLEKWTRFKTEADLGKTPKEHLQERAGRGGAAQGAGEALHPSAEWVP